MTYYDRLNGTMHDQLPEGAEPGSRWWNCFEGTPSACVNIGLNHIWVNEIDLVLSGGVDWGRSRAKKQRNWS